MSRAHGTICSGSRAARSFWICRMVSTPPASRSRFSQSETPAPKRGWCRGPTLPRSIRSRPGSGSSARLITGANPSWDMLEVASDRAEAAVPPGERRRGPARSIIWVSLESGTAKPMGLDPTIAAGGPPLPLTSGMWIEAGQTGCSAVGTEDVPDQDLLWRAIDQFHLGVAHCVRDYIVRDADRETERLVLRSELMTAQTIESFDRLADVVVQRTGDAALATDPTDPLLGACRMVAEAVRAPFVAPPQPALAHLGFAGRCRDRPLRALARSPHAAARRVVEGRWRAAGRLARRGAKSGRADPPRQPQLRDVRHKNRYAAAGRPGAGDGIGPGSRVILSGAAGPAAQVPGFADILVPARNRELLSYRVCGHRDRPAVAGDAADHQRPHQFGDPAQRTRPVDVLRAGARRHRDCDRRGPDHAGAGDAPGRGHDGLEAAGGRDRPHAEAAHLAVPRIYRGRLRRPLDGDRRGAAGLYRTRAAQRDVRPVRLVQHRPDVLL